MTERVGGKRLSNTQHFKTTKSYIFTLMEKAMKKFIVTFYLPEVLDLSFWKIIPEHRKYINQLMDDDVILTYGVNAERSKGWVVFSAATEEEVTGYIENFPIHDMITYEIEELFIFDSMIGVPRLVMN